MILSFMIFKNFAKDEHVGLTYDNMMGCIKEEIFKLSFGKKCENVKKDAWLVSVDISDSVLKKVSSIAVVLCDNRIPKLQFNQFIPILQIP